GGGVPSVFAKLWISPLSKSACVTVCVNTPVVDSPGASVVFSKLISSLKVSSLTFTSFNVTFPVFFTVNVYFTSSPTLVYSSMSATFSKEIFASCFDGTFSSDGGLTAGSYGKAVYSGSFLGGVPVVDSPGSNVDFSSSTSISSSANIGSFTFTFSKVTFPLLVTSNV